MAEKKTTDSRQQTGGTAEAIPNFMSAMLDMQKAGLGPLNWLGKAWVESLGEVGSEITQFVADRIQEDVRTQHEILHCRDATELQAIQARFLQKAIDQYTAETGKLVEKNIRLFDRLTQRDES